MRELPLSAWTLTFSLLIVFGAGIVRGCTGFGFSALSVAGLSLLVSPAQVVPALFALEILASVSLLRGARPHIDWRWLSWLALGNALCIPLGIAALAWLPPTPLRLLIGALLLLVATLLRGGVPIGLTPTPGMRLATGLASGFANGVAAIGGIVVALMLSTSQMAPAVMRATLIALFMFTDLYALAWAGVLTAGSTASLIGPQTLYWTLLLVSPMLAGIWVGQHWFHRLNADTFRRRVLDLLMLIAALSVLRAALALVA